MSIQWRRSKDGYTESHDGKYRIEPRFSGRTTPQWYLLFIDGQEYKRADFTTQRRAKRRAELYEELGR